MVADGKISDDTGRLWSTTAKKLVQLTAATVGVAGNLQVLDEVKRGKLHTAESVKDFLRDSAFLTPYELICYDHINDQLWSLDQNGMYVEYPYWVAVGIGGPIASGAIMMSSPPVDLDEALALGRQAVRATAALNGYCGGVAHWFVCHRSEAPVQPKAKKRRALEFNGSIMRFDGPSGVGLVKIGKRVFDFHVSRYSGGSNPSPPSAKMKVAVEISGIGSVLSLRPRKA
jgi:hypothetical protein